MRGGIGMMLLQGIGFVMVGCIWLAWRLTLILVGVVIGVALLIVESRQRKRDGVKSPRQRAREAEARGQDAMTDL